MRGDYKDVLSSLPYILSLSIYMFYIYVSIYKPICLGIYPSICLSTLYTETTKKTIHSISSFNIEFKKLCFFLFFKISFFFFEKFLSLSLSFPLFLFSLNSSYFFSFLFFLTIIFYFSLFSSISLHFKLS